MHTERTQIVDHRHEVHRTADHRTADHRTADHRTADHRTADDRTADCGAEARRVPPWREQTGQAVLRGARAVRRVLRDERGAVTAEYAIIIMASVK